MNSEGSQYYDRHGNPITPAEMIRLFEDPEARRVALDEIGDTVLSTVHLVIDHNFWGSGNPLIFETLCMEGSRDGQIWRYSTEEEARVGHAEILAELGTEQGVTLVEIELELAGLLS